MILERLTVGPLAVNCYIVGDTATREVAIIDPGGNPNEILDTLKRGRLVTKAIINTHAHFDHVIALADIRAKTGAPFYLHAADADILAHTQRDAGFFGMAVPKQTPADQLLQDGDSIQIGSLTLKVLHTPGHTPGGICLCSAEHVWVGDTLFQGSIGRTDLPGGDYGTLMASIRDQLLTLPDLTRVYPGHGEPTTIGEERQFNPFLRPLTTGQWTV